MSESSKPDATERSSVEIAEHLIGISHLSSHNWSIDDRHRSYVAVLERWKAEAQLAILDKLDRLQRTHSIDDAMELVRVQLQNQLAAQSGSGT
jgi:hypothetical protein